LESSSSSSSSPPSLSQFLRLLHRAHHTNQLVHHRLELFDAPLHPFDLVTDLREHVVHLGLGVVVAVVVVVFGPDVSVPFFQVDPARDLAGTDALAECEDAVDVVLQRRHFVASRRHLA
jgi:hypothetical protein